MSKKSKVISFIVAVLVIGLIIYLALPKCEICDSKNNVSEMYGHMICASCHQSVVDEAQKNSYSGYSSNYSSFTNKYGTSTTMCAHSGCTNYIATSGDTNCCITHSNRCIDCNCYIDEDAMFCISCIENAVK